MNLFDPIVGVTRQHPNFSNVLLPSRKAQRDLFIAWAEGFVDRDGKLVEEFQTTFNSSFWEIYLNAVFKEYSFEIDWTHNAPDFCVRAGGHEFIVEATTANAAQGKLNEWDKKLHPDEIKRIKLYELNKEAIIRLSNAISGKLKNIKIHTRNYHMFRISHLLSQLLHSNSHTSTSNMIGLSVHYYMTIMLMKMNTCKILRLFHQGQGAKNLAQFKKIMELRFVWVFLTIQQRKKSVQLCSVVLQLGANFQL